MLLAVRSNASISPNAIDDMQRVEAEISGHPCCRFDALIGGSAAENEVFGAIAAEIVF